MRDPEAASELSLDDRFRCQVSSKERQSVGPLSRLERFSHLKISATEIGTLLRHGPTAKVLPHVVLFRRDGARKRILLLKISDDG